MYLLSIDPGCINSAYVLIDTDEERIIRKGIVPNKELLYNEFFHDIDKVVIEMVESYGMAVGAEIFETVFWIGRFFQRYQVLAQRGCEKVYRKDIKLHLCHSARAKDSNVRQALLDRFGKPGTKKKPNAFYNDALDKMRQDIWSALAVGVYYWDNINKYI